MLLRFLFCTANHVKANFLNSAVFTQSDIINQL